MCLLDYGMNTIQEFLARNDKRQTTISIVGDTMIDEFYNVDASRVSPEFPIPVLRTDRHEPFAVEPGGAANVPAQMKNFNVLPQYFGARGVHQSYCDNFVYSVEGFEGHVPIKRRYFEGDFPLCRLDVEEPNFGLDEKHLPDYQLWLLEKFKQSKEEVVIFSDYAKGTFSDDMARQFVETAHAKETHPVTIVDPKKGPLNKWRGCSIFKPNAKEAADLTGESDSERQIDVIMREVECQAVVITQGSGGVIGNVMGRSFSYKPQRAVQGHPLGYSGAGDCFVAHLAMAMAHTMDIVHAVEVATEAAAVYVQRRGNGAITPHELGSRLDPAKMKFVSAEQLRKRDYKLVFTNGVYDILHEGHLHLLERAKSFGDKLVVAVNSNDSVERLNKSHALVNDIDSRMRMLAALELVDFVIEFNEDTPYNVIKATQPDVLVKGNEYQEPVGSDIVPEVQLVEMVEGASTTGVIHKIRGSIE